MMNSIYVPFRAWFLWAQLCHHLLHLSCDTDLAVCQMFEPLLFQIIHFVTQPSRLSQQGTIALLDCLMDATSNVQNSAVRDLSIRCLREFLQWTNRQCGGAQSNNDRRRIKNTLLEQLKTHALESNASHRYGSALAFNNLFRLLLQEDLQIVRYTFELMHSYSIGLIVTEEQSGWASDGNGAIAEQFLLALDHLAKLLEMRKALFDGHRSEVNRSEQLQLVPPDIGGRELKHLVCWLFRQCATRQRLHRHKCMQLFPRLAKAVQGVAGGEQFLEQHFTSEQIKSICLQADSAQGIERAPTLLSLWDGPTDPSVVSIYLWLEYLLATIDMYCWLEREKLIGEDLAHVLLCRILPAVHCFLRSVVDCSVHEIMATINRTREIHMSSYELRMNADKIVRFDALKSAVVAQIVDLLALLLSRTSEDNVPAECLALWQEQPVIDFILALLFKPHHQPGIDRNVSVMQDGQKNDHQRTAQLDALILQLMERCNSRVGQLFASALSEKLVAVMEDLGDRMQTLLTRRTIDTAYQKSAKGLLFIAKHQRNRGTHLMDDDKERVQQAARQLLTSCYEAIGQERVCLVLSPSAARFGTIVLEAVFSLSDAEDGLVDSIVAYCLSKDMLHPNIRHGEYFLVCFGSAVYELFLTKPSQCLDTLLQALSADSFPFIVRILCDLMEYSYRRQAAGDKERLESLSEALLNGWSQLFTISRLQPNHFGACDLQMIELMTSMMMICPFPLHKICSKVGPNYGRWLTELIGSSRAEVTIELKTKAIVLLPTVLGPGDTPDTTESHWESFESALETLQTLHFPLRSTEFLPNSPKRVGFLNCLERLLDAMIVSRSPLLLKAIIHMTAPDGEGHIAESKIRNAIERFFDDQPYEMQCDRLQELWELFSNHAYAPTVRETILRRYLCTALWHCQYDTIVQFYKRIIRTISSYTTEDINGRSGWDLEHALVDLAASFRLIEHYAALLPKSVLTGESCPVAKELYGSPKDEGAPVRGQRLVGDFSKRAHSVRRVVLLSSDRSAVELFRKYQCAAYRALVALISNTNEDARMYSVLLFRETREKGEYLWRHLIDCSNDELYLEGSQEQEETPRTVAKRVAIRQEGVGPPFPRSFSKDPGLSVVRESSLSQQVFRFDLNHSVVLSAREVAEKDAAELAKRQRGTLSSVSLERTKLNEHEAMATVCGCIRHMAASKVPLTAVVQFLAGSLTDAGQPKNVRLFLAKLIDNCRKELQPHASLLLCPLMQLIVDGSTVRGLNPLVTDLIALVLEWNGSSESKRQGAVDEAASLASVLLRFLVNHACQQQGARSTTAKALRLNLELIQELVSQWHDVLIVPAEVLYEMVSGSRQRLQSEERSQLQLIAGLQLGTIILTKGRGKLVPWMESTKQEYLRAVLRCLDLPDSTSFKSAALLLGHSLAHLYPEGLPLDDGDESVDELFHIECVAKLSAIQREYDRKFAEILYETAKGFPSIADPFLSVLSHRFPASAVAEKRMYLELLLGGRLETFKDDLYRELASMELVLLLRDNELQLPTLHLLNRSLPLVRETQHLQQLIEPIGSVTTEPATRPECRAVAYEILIYMHEHHFTKLSEECQHSVWRLLIRGLCGGQETDATNTSTRARILEYLTDSGKLPGDVKERFLFLLADLYDPTVEAQFLGSAVALLLDPAIRCRESKDRLFLHEYLDADVKFNEYTIETAARQRHTMTLLTPMFADTPQQRQLQSFITGRGSQMEQLIRATQFAGMGRTTQQDENGHFEPTQDPTRFTKGHETFAMPTQQTLLFEPSSLQLDRRSQRTTGSMSEPTQQERTFDRLRKRILRDSEANRQKQTTWAVRRHYSNQRQRSEQRRDAASQVTLYRRYRLADYPDLQINLLAFLLPLQALCRRDTACARQTFVAIFNGLVECLVLGDAAGRTVRMVGDEWDRFVRRLDASLQRILETTSKASDPNLFGGLIELTLGRASGKFTLAPRTIASVAGASNMLTMGALYLEAKLTDAADFDEEPVRTGGRITSEAEHWLQLSSLYQAMHEHSVLEGIFAEKLDSDPQLREAIELEALGRYDRAHRAYCELVMRISQARVEERNFCYKSAFNCLLQLGQWDVLLDEIGNQVTSHEELWSDDWNLENLLPNYVHGNVLLVLAGNEAGREFYNMLQQWLHIPDRAKHIRQQFGEALTALYISGQEMVRARMFGEQTERQFLDEWHCAGVLSGLVRTDCLLSVRKVIELVAYSELLEECTTDRLEQATAGLIASWQNARPASTDSLTTWDTLIAYRRFLLVKLESKCGPQGSDGVGDTLGNVSKLSRLLYELELQLLDVAFEQNNIKYAGRLIASLRNSESCVGLREPSVEHVLRRKIARIRFDRMRHVEGSSNQIQPLLRGFKQLAKINDQIAVVENEPDMARVKRTAWTEVYQLSESVRTIIKSTGEDLAEADSAHIQQMIGVVMKLPDEGRVVEGISLSERLGRLSTHCLQRSIDVLRPDSSSGSSALVELAEAHLRLARYCYEELSPERSEEEELPVERTLVSSLLPAIQYGSREARHLFPVLLQLRNLQNNTLRSEFHERSSLVPSWNFLPWIPQLLSYMKIANDAVGSHEQSDERHFLDALLMRLVKEHPMALYHPARLMLAGIEGRPVRPIVLQFRAALNFPVLDRFVDELCRVVMPETRLQHMLTELKSQLNSFTDPVAFHTFIDRTVPDVFPTDSNDLWRFGQAYRAALPLVDSFRTLMLLHPVDDRSVILRKLQELDDALQSMRPRTKTKHMQLEDLSPWLADFHCSSMRFARRGESSVEIPGQYGVDRDTPNPAQHATIVKVLPDVQVFVTLRQPIQITFRGSDGRQYRFLAKFGEDLRQDQRIQQLQREITHRLRWDRHCREHQLALRTYEVVPIRPNFGLFGWLEGTIALSDIAKQAAPRYNPGDRGQAHVLEEYGRFLLSVSRQDTAARNESCHTGSYNSPALYGMAAAFGMPDQLRSKYVELSQTLRACTLKRALYDMAASPESFYRLRMNFAKSLATMNMTCWALGIGDRHLSNVVLERATGMLVGVDFGIAFSAGTRDLPIPELVPFRLTPQFVGVMEPMRLAGLLQKCHLHTLQCLRDSRLLLRACLEVFVREPTVDWLRAARLRAADNADSPRASHGARAWNPQVRVNTVLRKLGGANPKQLLAEELRFGLIAQQREFLVGYLALVDASAAVSTEKVGREAVLSTAQQTEMLLEMAVDGKLLGITYGGWYPWF
uniref:non-specific serine/threonine protein kinase n=1 Tax=Anopheles stephensi TaxID=30069 RepID=A0A182XXN1_ANOST